MSYILQALKKSEQERQLAAQESSATPINASADSAITEATIRIDHGKDGQVFPLAIYGWIVGFIFTLLLISGLVQYQFGKQDANILKTDNQESVIQGIATAEIVSKPIETVVVEAQPLLIPIEQAPQMVQSSVPVIDISSHIFSSLPERRSIVINGARLVEGDFIAPAVQVKEITHQGMIIAVEGQSLIVDRSRGWSR